VETHTRDSVPVISYPRYIINVR